MYANEDKAGAEKALFRLASQRESSQTPLPEIRGIYTGQSDSSQIEPDQPGGAMRTLLRAFADEFSDRLQPLLKPIRQTVETLDTAGESCRAKTILPDLRDLHHQVSALIEKVSAQQAYVLIFGPLKSGKSTFMNAMCGSYISEVTALPAYPCLVNVSHSEKEQFSITRYDGSSEEIQGRELLRQRVEADHVALIERIRQVEASGESFDPIGHMSQAIRKIDVKLPAGQLGASGAVLVDTPGLYTKMKFGYDRMTRDFRSSAACAIFIVKTDNLFLEQVFDEFGELLELFSRVFLVVNLDHSKQDLQPDGSLAPSLEREDPARIVRTFQDLSMSASLSQAAEEGRLRIYPVDLLRSASRRIRGQQNPEEPTHGETRFETLAEDLGSYLNSNEYLREFLRDSLKRGSSLLGELAQLVEDESVQDLGDQRRMLQDELQRCRDRREALKRIAKVDWNRQAGDRANQMTASMSAEADRLHENITLALTGAIDEWFQNDQPLVALNDRAGQLLKSAQEDLLRLARHELAGLASKQVEWLEDASVRKDLQTAGIDLEEILQGAVEIGQKKIRLEHIQPRLEPGNIPIRKTLWDWLLLRSTGKVRKRVLGDGTCQVDAAEKSKRIGDAGRDAMRQMAVEQLDSLLKQASDELPRMAFEAALDELRSRIGRQGQAMIEQTGKQINQTSHLLEQVAEIVESTDSLRDAVNDASVQLERIEDQYRFEESSQEETDEADEEAPQQEETQKVIELEGVD